MGGLTNSDFGRYWTEQDYMYSRVWTALKIFKAINACFLPKIYAVNCIFHNPPGHALVLIAQVLNGNLSVA